MLNGVCCFLPIHRSRDYIPFVSTASSLVDLFRKCVVLPFIKPEAVQKSHFYTRISQTNLLRSVVLLVPILGNIVIGLLDLYAATEERDRFLKAVEEDPESLVRAGHRIQDDKGLMLLVLKKNADLFEDISERLQHDRDIVRVAVSTKGAILENVDSIYKDDPEVVSLALENDPFALQFASYRLNHDRKIVSKALLKNGMVLQHAVPYIRKNKEMVFLAAKSYPHAFELADESLKNDREFIREAIKKKFSLALAYASPQISKDRDFVKELVEIDPWVFRDAHRSLRGDQDFAVQLLPNNPAAILSGALDQLRNNVGFCLAAVRQSEEALEHVPQGLRAEVEDLRLRLSA